MQLEACGIVETIHISAAGFPIRSNFFVTLLGFMFIFGIYLTFSKVVFCVLQDCFQSFFAKIRTICKTC